MGLLKIGRGPGNGGVEWGTKRMKTCMYVCHLPMKTPTNHYILQTWTIKLKNSQAWYYVPILPAPWGWDSRISANSRAIVHSNPVWTTEQYPASKKMQKHLLCASHPHDAKYQTCFLSPQLSHQGCGMGWSQTNNVQGPLPAGHPFTP